LTTGDCKPSRPAVGIANKIVLNGQSGGLNWQI
jgi:hypothetical protein